MGVFGDKQVAAAILRVPASSTKSIHTLLQQARANRLPRLEAACEAELALRPIEMSGEEATRALQMAKAVVDMSLEEAIRYAFGAARSASAAEELIIGWIGRNPGTSYEATLAHYGKGDLGLVIGHLVYDRIGCFRHFLDPKEDQSSVLMSKDRGGRSVRYTFKPEADRVFRELGLI